MTERIRTATEILSMENEFAPRLNDLFDKRCIEPAQQMLRNMIKYVWMRTGVRDVQLGTWSYIPWYIIRIPGET